MKRLAGAAAFFACGLVAGWFLYAYLVMRPAREAMVIALRDEMSQMEKQAIDSFRTTIGRSAISGQRQFLAFVQQRKERRLVDDKDAQRAIAMAKLRIAVEYLLAKDDAAYRKTFEEAKVDLLAAGITQDAADLVKVLEREKLLEVKR